MQAGAMDAVEWIPTIRDGRCFWDAIAKAVQETDCDELKARALNVDDWSIQSLVAKYGGGAAIWRKAIDHHRKSKYQYADHYAIAPTAANVRLLLVIWDSGENMVWTYRPARYDRMVLLKLEDSHFEVADPQSFTQQLLESVIAGCCEGWEKNHPLLRGGGRKKKKRVMGAADIALEAPATVHQWDERPGPTDGTWNLSFLNVGSLRMHIEQVLALQTSVKVLVETRVWGSQYESLCNLCQKQGYEVAAAESVLSDCDGHNGVFILAKRPLVVEKVEHIDALEKWRQVARVQVVNLLAPSGDEVCLIAAYCYAEDVEKRHEMHHDLIEFVATNKNKKCLLLGDFNQDVGTIWPMEFAKTTGALVDLVEECSGISPTTCKSGAPSSRTIDFALATERLFPEVRAAQ
eukprot:6131026-Amphidinium_carterae.1